MDKGLDTILMYMVYPVVMGQGETTTIGQLATAAKVNIQTIRFYERQGILRPLHRTGAGYRVYDKDSLKRLNFILQAKELGFSLKEINDLLGLRVRSVQTCDRVRKKAQEKLTDIQGKISRLKKMEKTLKALIGNCKNRVMSDQCPILEKMEV